MSDTNRVKVGLVEETTWGTIPTSPAWNILRVTGTPNLGYVPNSVTSDEIRSDRQVTDLILVGAEASGDIGMELSFDAFTELIEGALFNDWTEQPEAVNLASDTPITSIATPGTFETVSIVGLGTSTFGSVVSNALFEYSGFTNSGNNGIFNTVSVAQATGTELWFSNGSAVAEAAPPSGARVKLIGLEGALGDITTTAGATNSIDSDGGDVDFTDFEIAAGDWIKVGGALAVNQTDTAANNDWVRVSAVAAASLTLDIVPSGWSTDDSGDNSAKRVRLYLGDKITNSTTEKSYSIEQQFEDHTSEAYQTFTGMEVNTMTINMPAESIMVGTVSFLGETATLGTVRTSGSTEIDAPANTVLNTSSNVGRIAENGTEITTTNYVLEATIEFNNNLRKQTAVGTLGAIGIGAGEFGVSGTLNTYFDDTTLAAKVIANTETSFDIRVGDSTDKVVLFDLPRMKYGSGIPDVPSKNQDVTVGLDFQAIRDATLGYTVKVQQFWNTQEND